MIEKNLEFDTSKKADTCVQMTVMAQQEGATGAEYIKQPAKGVYHTIQEAVEGSAQEDLEEKAGWDAFEGSMPVGQTAIKVRTVRGAQATMTTHMVGYEVKVVVGDTTNVVIKDTGNTRGAPPLPGGAE